MNLPEDILDRAVETALSEDRAFDDITTSLLVPEDMTGVARIFTREDGIISGQECAERTFLRLDPDVAYRRRVSDGGAVRAGDVVAEISGRLAAVISAERTALNFLGHLSGVATRTGLFAAKLEGTGIRVLDTRKTLPGLRALEKKAVIDGGGENHRHDLGSYLLVKENHIAAAGGMEGLAELLGAKMALAEVEVSSLDQLGLLAETPPARVMLDNFGPAQVAEAVGYIGRWKGSRPEIEVSGGIGLDNIEEYAIAGIDFISVGSLTSSARSLDLSMLAGGEEGGQR